MNFLYILRCEDNSLYTGVTKELHQRMDAHFHKKKAGAKYTKSRQPKEICMVWEADSWSNACKLEYFVKSLTKSRKEELIQEPESLEDLFLSKQSRMKHSKTDDQAENVDQKISCKVCRSFENYPVALQEYLAD